MSATSARNQLVCALLIALPARERRAACQGETDADDDRACDYRRKETHDALYADKTDDQREHQIQKTGYYDAAAGVGQFFAVGHICKYTGVKLGNSCKSAEECK